MAEQKRKFLVMVMHGPENPEMATLAFMTATAALASNIEVVMGFQSNGTALVKKGVADSIEAPGAAPLRDLLQMYLEAGGRMLVCGVCAEARKIAPHDLTDGASIAGAATFVAEAADATNVFTY